MTNIVVATTALLLVLGGAWSAPARYDQRQDGETNIHAHLENIIVLLIPSGDGSLLGVKALGDNLSGGRSDEPRVKDEGNPAEEQEVTTGGAKEGAKERSEVTEDKTSPEVHAPEEQVTITEKVKVYTDDVDKATKARSQVTEDEDKKSPEEFPPEEQAAIVESVKIQTGDDNKHTKARSEVTEEKKTPEEHTPDEQATIVENQKVRTENIVKATKARSEVTEDEDKKSPEEFPPEEQAAVVESVKIHTDDVDRLPKTRSEEVSEAERTGKEARFIDLGEAEAREIARLKKVLSEGAQPCQRASNQGPC